MTYKYSDEIIEQFFFGSLSGSERSAFEKEMQENQEFGQHVSEQILIMQAISDLDQDLKVSGAIKEAASQYFDSNTVETTAKVRKIGWTKWAIAAAAGLAILLAVTFLLTDQSFDSDQAFAQYFEPGAMLEIDRTPDSLNNNVLVQGYSAYQKGDYKSAINLFSTHFSGNLPSPRDLNYAGMAALALTEPALDLAASYFLRILNSGDNIYVNSANWHLALISLKKNDGKGAVTYLEKLLQEPTHKYTERSRQLLKDLK